MKSVIWLLFFIILSSGAAMAKKTTDKAFIDGKVIEQAVKELVAKYGETEKPRIERGLKQIASLWKESDGKPVEFLSFCVNNYLPEGKNLDKVFDRLSQNFETIGGYFTRMMVDVRKPLDLDIYELLDIDEIFAGYSPMAHLKDDFFANKLAFHIILNFPAYTLAEKESLGDKWTSRLWAYARLGDIFTSRVPADVQQGITEAITNADAYIASYNIFVGYLVDEKGKTFFPKDKKLITHWNLRDELKSQYSQGADGLIKQKYLYEVMKRIITQEIPESVINSNKYTWNPFANKVFDNGKEIPFKSEPNTRYQKLLTNFMAVKQEDKYSPQYPTYIKRKFEQEMEIPQEQVEKLFIDFVSSPTIRKVGAIIKQRLGRDLQPFDIWYDGFKARSSISEAELDKVTKAKYPDRKAFAGDLPNIMVKLGFSAEKARKISDLIEVEPSRGPGHALGAEMKSMKSYLRTRIGKDGMDYKGYNIAVHEFGHNVEQTITIHDVDYFMLKGVPNTAFTEAWAFVFQKRDLELLGIKDENVNKKHLLALDNLWSTYEIMGVSLVDMNVWKWLYQNPDANEQQLKDAVISIAKDVWNKYYADVFGIKDQPILAIYSHMIDNPLYLCAYPIGHVIEFQMEKYIEGKNLAEQMQRMLSQGRLIPQLWMKGAVGSGLSTKPSLDAAEEALKFIK